MKAGASGFLLKDVPRDQLIDGVRTVAAGEALLAPAITRRLIEQFVERPPAGRPPPPELEQLTARELEVLKLVARGCSNAEIAAELFVGEATVKTHVAHASSASSACATACRRSCSPTSRVSSRQARSSPPSQGGDRIGPEPRRIAPAADDRPPRRP